MSNARSVAAYFLKLDKAHSLFNDTELVEKNGRRFYAGNARLNKYIHLAKNIYFAKTGAMLFEEDIYAYDNGGVVPSVQENYKMLLSRRDKIDIDLKPEEKDFLDKMYLVLEGADLDKLIELSHQDPEWVNKRGFYRKEDQIMDTEAHLETYQEQYKDIIRIMDGM